MKTIVSVTPLRVEADSRTYKIASSFKRFGYDSVVIEAEESRVDRSNLLFKLISPKVIYADSLFENSAPKSKGIKSALKVLLKILFSSGRFFFRYFLQALLQARRADLYYLHSFEQFPAVYLLSRIHRVPYVYDAHDFYSGQERIEEALFYRRYLAIPFFKYLERLCIKHAAAVVTVGRGIAALYEKAFGCRAIVVTNCHDVRLDRESIQDIRRKIGLSSSDFLLVAVGRTKPSRATQEAIEAVALLPAYVNLAFVGIGYEGYIDYIRRLKLQNRVHILAPVKPDEIVPFIRTADASLILYYPRSANDENSLPNVFFQSISAGLPLLYPALGEMVQIAKRYQMGIPINPQSPESIRQAVSELIGNEDKFLFFKRNVQSASYQLSWEHEENILYDLLRKLFL